MMICLIYMVVVVALREQNERVAKGSRDFTHVKDAGWSLVVAETLTLS